MEHFQRRYKIVEHKMFRNKTKHEQEKKKYHRAHLPPHHHCLVDIIVASAHLGVPTICAARQRKASTNWIKANCVYLFVVFFFRGFIFFFFINNTRKPKSVLVRAPYSQHYPQPLLHLFFGCSSFDQFSSITSCSDFKRKTSARLIDPF